MRTGDSAEFDCALRIYNARAIGEAKSGARKFRLSDAEAQAQAYWDVFGERPSYILGVPGDHRMIREGEVAFYRRMGLNILPYHNSEDLRNIATRLMMSMRDASAGACLHI